MWLIHLVLRSFAAWQLYLGTAGLISVMLSLVAVAFCLPHLIDDHVNGNKNRRKALREKLGPVIDEMERYRMWREEQEHFPDNKEDWEDYKKRMTGKSVS